MTDETTTPETETDEAVTPEDLIAHFQAEADQWKEKALRAAADAENTKRRAEREANDARAYAIQKFARDLLGVADNLSRALQAAPKDSQDQGMKNLVLGVEMTEQELVQAFERNGLKRVHPARGDRFDPNLHQAMLEQPAEDVPAGGVIQVLQTGYELFGRIVRPAMVVVAAKGSGAADPYRKADGAEPGEAVDAKA
ncbi:MAG TPA: nucleotide exchange factor GrpE [Caulobacteraceae bacterium]|nr:nucleotide exchange factor GrpE [Caulobacteraceae bacterium]